MSTDRMEPVDYLLYRADLDPRRRSSMMSIELLDVVPLWEHIRYDFERASRLVRRLRQKVVAPSLPVAGAEWVVDPDFHLDYHLRRVRLPEPGDLRQLLDLSQQLLAGPLDPSRPLWEATLVEGLDVDGAKAALVMKLSHAITDGVGGIELDLNVKGFERHPERGQLPPLPIPKDVTPGDLNRAGLRRLPWWAAATSVKVGLKAAVLTGSAMRDPVGIASRATRFAASAQRVVGSPPVEPSPLLRRRSLKRRLDTIDVPLAGLRAAGRSVRCSVNDAYVAAVCGTLRLYHERLGVPIDTMNLALPVSLRVDDDPAGGNRWAGARIAAPVGVVDPGKRMEAIREQVALGRREPAIEVLRAVAPLVSRLPVGMIETLGSSALANDVQVSNVPGHTQRRFVGGAEVVRLVPIGPLPGPAMMIVMLSQNGTCYVGVNYDTVSVADPPLSETCLRDGFDEVLNLAEARPPDAPRSRPAAEPAAVAIDLTDARAEAGAGLVRAEAELLRRAATTRTVSAARRASVASSVTAASASHSTRRPSGAGRSGRPDR
jgi:diacylglycerol O-acyltransferase / wax synthase